MDTVKEIIVKRENATAIMAEFDKEQGKATARTIRSFDEFMGIIADINDRLKGISKKALDGTVVNYTFAQKFPNAYKYTPESTHFTLTFKRGEWRISGIARHICPNRYNNGYAYDMMLSDTAKEAVLKLYE